MLQPTKYPACSQEASRNALTIQHVIGLISVWILLQTNTNLLHFVHLGTFLIVYLVYGDYVNGIIYKMYILNNNKKHITLYLLNFRVMLSSCGLHAIEDPNPFKPVCLKSAELRGDSLGIVIPLSQEGCSLDNLGLDSCPLLRLLREAED